MMRRPDLSGAEDGCDGGRTSCPDRCNQQPASHEVHDAPEVVGEDVQRHLASDTRQRLHQEVHRSCGRPEVVLDRLAPLRMAISTARNALVGIDGKLDPSMVVNREVL